MLPTIGEVAGDKGDLRRAVLRRRAARDPRQVAADDHARADLLLARLTDPPSTVAAYLSAPGEPGTGHLLEALHDAGVTVLLPRLPRLRREPDWAAYEGRDRIGSGRWGIPEPAGAGLGAGALAAAAVIVVPGLLGTPSGRRLGRGGGWYDRALVHASPAARVWLLLNDDEVVDEVPSEPHDLPVTALVTPTRWVACRE